MNPVDAYLTISDEAAQALGGLAWSLDGEALRRGDGSTFALTEEVLFFLEGFASQRSLVPFGYLLLAYGLLRGRWGPAPGIGPGVDRLRLAFTGTGRPERNAGALFGHLLESLPPVAEPPLVANIWARAVFYTSQPLALATQGRPAIALPLAPEAFLHQVERRLASFNTEQIETWLRTGAGPIEQPAEQLVEEMDQRSVRSLEELLAGEIENQRLSGAQPLVEQLGAALSLPPRQLSQPELPLGGYSDVTTRGHPDQLLLSQFALDELELLRRLSEKELLYYRREEPRGEVREQLLLVLDQGVRTWGTPRLVLLAATLLLARLAAQRKVPYRLVTTGQPGPPWNAAALTREELAARLGGSDLGEHPGLALEAALQEPASVLRDVILLTHPRTLGEADVQAAACRLAPDQRLFALTVDREGQAELAQIHKGQAVPLKSFKVHFPTASKRPPRRTSSTRPLWTGDVEANPCLFVLNPGPGPRPHFIFDASESDVLMVLADGMLLLTPLHGQPELLPRARTPDGLLTRVEWLQGIPCGFLVGGRSSKDVATLARYNMAERKVTTWTFAEYASRDSVIWSYNRRLECVVVADVVGLFYTSIDLVTGERRNVSDVETTPGSRAWAALDLQNIEPPRPELIDVLSEPPTVNPLGCWITLDSTTGRIQLFNRLTTVTFTPQTNGQPALQGATLSVARRAGDLLALQVCLPAYTSSSRSRWLYFLNWDDGRFLHQIPLPVKMAQHQNWMLSPHGAWVAFAVETDQVSIRSTRPEDRRSLTTLRSRTNVPRELILGEGWLLMGQSPSHRVTWNGPELTTTVIAGTEPLSSFAGIASIAVKWPDFLAHEPGRYLLVKVGSLIAALDYFGVVTLFDRLGSILAQIVVRGSKIAVATPHGHRLGHVGLLGQLETVDAAREIATLLRSAEREAREVTT